jgi:hypothetical protein
VPEEKTRIGWREWVALPALGLSDIKAKIDTGARTSALHAFDVEPYTENGVEMIWFAIHPIQKRNDIVQECRCVLHDQRWVSDSGGHREKRYVIQTDIHMAGQTWPIELTLTNRDTMKFRMLLGRTAMSGRLVVDPSSSYVLGKRKSHT